MPQRSCVFVAVLDPDVILRQQQAPAGFRFDAAVAGALALLQARGAERVAGHFQPLDVGAVGQHAEGILVAALGRRQQEVGVGALAQPIHAETGFQCQGLAEHHVLPIDRFQPGAGLIVHAHGHRQALGRRLHHPHLHGQRDLAIGIVGRRGRRLAAGNGRVARGRRSQGVGRPGARAVGDRFGRGLSAGLLQRHEGTTENAVDCKSCCHWSSRLCS